MNWIWLGARNEAWSYTAAVLFPDYWSPEVCRDEVLNEAMLLEAFLETGALRSVTGGSTT
jgi:hypothetical protein